MKTVYIKKVNHSLTDFMTFIIAEKETILELDKKEYQLKAGNIILTRENIHFDVSDMSDVTIICFKKAFFGSVFFSEIADCRIMFDFFNIENPQNEILFFDYDDTAPTYPSAKILEKEIGHVDEYRDKLVQLYCVALITHLQQSHHDHLVLNKSSMGKQHRFGKLLKYMGENYPTVTLKELADRFGYNPDYLSYRFKAITHQTFKEKLMDIRLEEACRCLESTELNIEEISTTIGFKDKSFFLRKFKEKYNLTPAKYRKAHLNGNAPS